jgi:formate dehydrogenase major subunit
MNRRDWLKRTAVGAAAVAGLALPKKQAEAKDPTAGAPQLSSKLADAKVFTTACNFCSCGCGMLCYVKDGKLIDLEGDPNHIVNEGALCSKGAAIIAAHESDRRARQPLYRAPGSDHWQPISWDEALDKVARKMKQTRDDSWIQEETAKDATGKESAYIVNRTDAVGFLGGAQNTNEECYLLTKMSRLLGTVQVEHQARL